MPGRDLRTSENQATIIVGERNCSTVAVAAFDFSMVSKKVSCTVSAPTTEKISRLMASLWLLIIEKILSPWTNDSVSRIKPANIKRVIVKNCDDIWLCSMMYCAQTPELPHNTAAIRTFSIPFLVEPIFPSAYCFVVYVCRHDSKNGEDGSVCATPIFLSPDWWAKYL